MICEMCHGNGVLYNGLLMELRPCVDCNGSGISYCCDNAGSSVTPESKLATMKENITRVQYWHDVETTDNTGWYICHFGTTADLLANSPEDVIGPFDSQSEAIRVFNETLTLDAEDKSEEKKVRPYDPSRDKVVLKMSDDETDIRVQSEERHEGGLSEPVQSVHPTERDTDAVGETTE